MRRNLNMMIKPSSSKCNLKCKYCFYNSISEAREVEDYGFMSKDTIEEIVKKAKEYCNGGVCTIGFQGGESLLVGIDFYKHLVKAIETDNNGTRFNLTIQTNATLINDEWACFFKDYNFLVGVSLDGTEEIHNLNRLHKNNKGSYEDVIRGIEILKQHEVEFNILTVVTSQLCEKIEEVYKFYKDKNYKYLQFIPCIEPLENNNISLNDYSLSVREYGDFLIKLFDKWYEDLQNGNHVSIRYFDNILALFMGYEYEACEMKGRCSCQNIIESDGSVFPCDFYTYENYKIGNIKLDEFNDLMKCDKTISFIESSLNANEGCYECKFRMLCRDGCRRLRDGESNRNYFCEAYYKFFSYTFEKLKNINL
ncbi:MAG: anaerobic sulfatase maturase [Clostridium sp.]